jgi:hypothetical protein
MITVSGDHGPRIAGVESALNSAVNPGYGLFIGAHPCAKLNTRTGGRNHISANNVRVIGICVDSVLASGVHSK